MKLTEQQFQFGYEAAAKKAQELYENITEIQMNDGVVEIYGIEEEFYLKQIEAAFYSGTCRKEDCNYIHIETRKGLKEAQDIINEWGRGSDYDLDTQVSTYARLDAIKDYDIFPEVLKHLRNTCETEKDYYEGFDPRIHIAKRVRDLRTQAGMTQEDLAEKTGLKRPNIARIERGKYSTGLDILNKISQIFEMKVDIV